MTEKSCCRGWDNKLLNIITHDRWSFPFWSLIFLIYKIKTKCQSHKCDILSWALYSLEIKGIFIASLTVHLSSQDNGEAQITQYNIHYYKVNIMVVRREFFHSSFKNIFVRANTPTPLTKQDTEWWHTYWGILEIYQFGGWKAFCNNCVYFNPFSCFQNVQTALL